MSDKPKFPREIALEVAELLREALKLTTVRTAVAGSLRRGRDLVGDVEILYIPRMGRIADGFFDYKEVNKTDIALADLEKLGIIAKRPNKEGHFTWGEKNKLALYTGMSDERGFPPIPIDFFATTEASWFNYLVCRTGSAETNVTISNAAIKKGWRWHPYNDGFTDSAGKWHHVNSEEDVFRLAGLPYLEPHQR